MRLFNSDLVEELGDFGALVYELIAENHEFLGYVGVEVALLAVSEGLLDVGYFLLALLEKQEGLLILVLPDQLGDPLPRPFELLHRGDDELDGALPHHLNAHPIINNTPSNQQISLTLPLIIGNNKPSSS